MWAILAVIWIFPSAWLTFQNFPQEQQVHVAANQAQRDAMDARRAKEDEVRHHCHSISGGNTLAYTQCLDINNGTQGLSSDERRAITELKNTQFHNALRETTDRIITNGLEQLPKNQAWVALQGLLIWAIPLLTIYALGLGVAWIKSGFKK